MHDFVLSLVINYICRDIGINLQESDLILFLLQNSKVSGKYKIIGQTSRRTRKTIVQKVLS